MLRTRAKLESTSRLFEEQPRSRVKNKRSKEDDRYKNYIRKDEVSRVFENASMYIESDKHEERDELIYNSRKSSLQLQKVDYPIGFLRLFCEVLINASDNVKKSRDEGYDPKQLELEYDRHTIIFKNYGRPIPITKHKEYDMLVPDMIYSELGTGSNYDTEDGPSAGGRYGLGTKIVNIYSKLFTVELVDEETRLSYARTWTNNLKESSDAVVDDSNESSYVKVTYTIDFERFGYDVEEGYPVDFLYSIERLMLGTSMSSKIPIQINGKKYNLDNIKDFGGLVIPKGRDTLTHKIRLWDDTNNDLKNVYEEYVEFLLADTPDSALSISFANGIPTTDHGNHLDLIHEQIFAELAKKLSDRLQPKNKDAKTRKRALVKVQDFIPHISIIVNFWSKSLLTKGGQYKSKGFLEKKIKDRIKLRFPDKSLKRMEHWEATERVILQSEALMEAMLSKTDGKKRIRVKGGKLIDAAEAGGKQSERCELYLTEGDSGQNLVEALKKYKKGGEKYIGIFPMRGKLKNARNVDIITLLQNIEVRDIKIAMGMEERVDYTLDENRRKLRYNSIIIAADQDPDGSHCKGLVANLFDCRYDTLLEIGLVRILQTPLLRANYRNQSMPFFSNAAFEKAKLEHDWLNKATIRYYKGLGGSSCKQIKQDINVIKTSILYMDNEAKEHLDLVFSNKKRGERKEWIKGWTVDLEPPTDDQICVTDFVNTDLLNFSVYNMHRNLPCFADGLRIAYRKILWTALQYWKFKARGELVKTAILGYSVAKDTQYHHGEENLVKSINNMAQFFAGTNNLPYFIRQGQFGSRANGGKASAGRYTHVALEDWIPYWIRSEDLPLLELLEDENKKIEPSFLLPVFPNPNFLIGIGSGYSSTILPVKPLNYIDYLINKCLEKLGRPFNPTEVDVYFHGFNGEMYTLDRNTDKVENTASKKITSLNLRYYTRNIAEELDEESDKSDSKPRKKKYGLTDEEYTEEYEAIYEEVLRKSHKQLITRGILEIDTNYKKGRWKINITELPIWVWTNKFVKEMETRCGKKDEYLLEKPYNNSAVNDVNITLIANSEKLETILKTQKVKDVKEWLINDLGLEYKLSFSNMNMLDPVTRIPRLYKTHYEILDHFFEFRLPWYEKRKEYEIKVLEEKIQKTKEKIIYISLLHNKQLAVANRPEADVERDIAKHNLSKKMLEITQRGTSKESKRRLEDKVKKLEKELKAKMEMHPEDMWINELTEARPIVEKYENYNEDDD